MLKKAATLCSIAFAISCCSVTASAQWAVHALAGTLKSTNASAKTIILNTDDGTPGDFQIPQIEKVKMNFDKEVRAVTVAPDKLSADKGQVIVFFFLDGGVRSAVAIESVGEGPFQNVTGSVIKFDKHEHALTLQTETGEKTFTVNDKSIVDTPDGVVPGRRFSAERGDHVRMLIQQKDGKDTILLIRFDGNPT